MWFPNYWREIPLQGTSGRPVRTGSHWPAERVLMKTAAEGVHQAGDEGGDLGAVRGPT